MLVIAACLLALLSPLVAGRWSSGLLLTRWRHPWIIWVALGLQVVLVQVPLPGAAAPVLHVATYVAALGFLVANRRTAGVLVVGVGAACNGVTIALNGGVLPAAAGAVAASGLESEADFHNSAVVADPVLPWLGDVFAWPAPLPLANTFSVGDVVIVLGVFVAAWSGTRPLRRSPAPDGRDDAAPGAVPASDEVRVTGSR